MGIWLARFFPPIGRLAASYRPGVWDGDHSDALPGDLRARMAGSEAGGFAPWKLAVGIPLVFAFLLIEVGLVEEFFFRTLLQSRLSAWLKSEVGGVVTAALLFGLVHAPGLYFRPAATQEGVGPHPSLLTAVGYSVVITSVAGLFLCVLWSRTRNLLLVMVVHAAGDLVPNLAPMIRNLLG